MEDRMLMEESGEAIYVSRADGEALADARFRDLSFDLWQEMKEEDRTLENLVDEVETQLDEQEFEIQNTLDVDRSEFQLLTRGKLKLWIEELWEAIARRDS